MNGSLLHTFLRPRRGDPGAPALTGPPTRAQVLALVAAGSGRRSATTADDADDPRLRPRLLPHAPDTAAELVRRAIAVLPGWRIRSGHDGLFWAERRTRVFRFVDDVYLLLEPADDASAGATPATRILAWSGSRLGRGDLGQNRRNLAELWRALSL